MTRRPPRGGGSGRRSGSRDGDGGLGGDQVEGRRAVRELLVARRRTVQAVYRAETARADDLLREIDRLAGDVLTRVAPERLAALARTDAHQGVVARAAPVPAVSVDDLLAVSGAFLVALDGVTDPQNLGAIIRTAETAGATGMLLPRRRSAGISPAVTKAAAGAIEYLAICPVSGVPAALDRARRRDVWTVGLDERGERTVWELGDLARSPLVLVLGAEGRGLSRLTAERCDLLVRIPCHDRVTSLNVAAAAAVALHEVAHQRARDG